jgi:tetratricopeptide (TPR) repeat protein
MRFKKLEERRLKLRVNFLALLLCFYPLIYGEYTFDWTNQTDAIRRLAVYENGREAEEAGKILLKIVSEEQVMPLLELLGEVCLKGKRYRQAADYYLRASKSTADEKENFRYLIIAADAYYQHKDYDLAAAIYGECYHRGVDDEVLFRYGCALLHGENFEKLKELTFKSERLQARFDWNCATYWNRKGDFGRSLHHLEPWVKGGIRDVKYYYFYAQMQYRLGKINEAFQAISWGKMLCLNGITAETIPLFTLQMRMDCAQRDFESAAKIEQALRTQESVDWKKILLGKVRGLQKSGNRAMVLETLEKLAAIDGSLGEFIRGEIYFEEGNFAKSLECFRATENGGGQIDYAARFREGSIEAYLGNFGRAEMIYEKLLNDIAAENTMNRQKNVLDFLQNSLARTRLALNRSL